jgi:hypothetical protein
MEKIMGGVYAPFTQTQIQAVVWELQDLDVGQHPVVRKVV